MPRFSYMVLCAILCLCAGCDNKPFEVLAPAFRSEEGNALISVQVPPFSRGLIQRVTVRVTSADTARVRQIERDLNFPIPGGTLAVGEVVDIPAGKRRFTVTAFDTYEVLRFQGESDSTVATGRTKLVHVTLERIGGTVDFRAVIDMADIDASEMDSTALASLPLTSVLDILELIPQPHHPELAMLPLLSVGLGDRFTVGDDGIFSRRITVSQIPTGSRRFVAHLRDLSSNGLRAFADTLSVDVDTLRTVNAVFKLEMVKDPLVLFDIFSKTTLPRDSTVVVVTPEF